MSLLLLVRSADDVRSAVFAASEFLVYRRRRFPEPPGTEEVLGICLRRELEADLPAWPCPNRKPEAGVPVGVSRDARTVRQEKASVGIRESLSLSGLWALCWIDGTPLRAALGAAECRVVILDWLVAAVDTVGRFFPVFAASDSVEGIRTTMRELQDRYPQIINRTWFFDDRERGLVLSREVER